MVQRGLDSYASERYEEALEYFDKAISLDPKSGHAWAKKGFVLFKVGRSPEALEALDRAIGIIPEDYWTWNDKGLALYDLERFSEALEALDRAIGINPNELPAWLTSGQILCSLKRFEEAIVRFDKAITIEPQLDIAWYDKGEALTALGRFEEAVRALDRAIELKPNDAKTWTSKAEALTGLGRYEDAITACDKALEIDSENVTTWNIKGSALKHLGRDKEADASVWGEKWALHTNSARSRDGFYLFDCVGFTFKTDDEVLALVEGIIADEPTAREGKVAYFLRHFEKNIEVRVVVSNGKVLDATPFYLGESTARIKIERMLDEGSRTRIHCWAGLDGPTQDRVPMIVEVPDFYALAKKPKMGSTNSIALTAFAGMVEFYQDEQDFRTHSPVNRAYRGGSIKRQDGTEIKGYASDYFLPIGLFHQEGYPEEPTAQFAGTIRKASLQLNSASGGEFYWIIVKTMFGDIDIVCPKEMLNDTPKVGGILEGKYYLMGKFLRAD